MNETRYRIAKLVFEVPTPIEISEQDYRDITLASDQLFEALYLEEKFDLLAENYLEFEIELLSSAARHMLFRDHDYARFQTERSLVNRRIANLLSSCRPYLDQCIHHLRNIYGDHSSGESDAHNEMKAQYDNHFGYRAMEALRNYAQHTGFPVPESRFR